MDTRHFFVDPAFFSGKTGTWYGLISKKPVFKVEDPWIQLDVVEQGIDHEPEWIKKGNLVSFKISSNMYLLQERPGSAGVPVRINLTGPNETTFTTLQSPTGTYNLEKIFVYYSPFDTGAVRETKDDDKYPEGEYTAWATILANDIAEKNSGDGVTTSLKTTFVLSKIKPEKEKESEKDGSDKKSGTESEDTDSDNSEKETDIPTPTPTPTHLLPVPELTLDITQSSLSPPIDVTAKPTKPPLPSHPKKNHQHKNSRRRCSLPSFSCGSDDDDGSKKKIIQISQPVLIRFWSSDRCPVSSLYLMTHVVLHEACTPFSLEQGRHHRPCPDDAPGRD